jgi:uncharacterized protein YecE (DUF72 family)
MRVPVELRHHSWTVDPVFDLLSRHRATYVVMSGADLPCEWHRQHLGVFAYFNNDGYGHAVTNARRLRNLTNS